MALKNKFAFGMLMFVICVFMLITTHQVAEADAVSSSDLNGHLQVTGGGEEIYDVADSERTSSRRELGNIFKGLKEIMDLLGNLNDIYEIWNDATGKLETWNSTKVNNQINEQSRVQQDSCNHNIFLLLPLSASSPSPLPSPSLLPPSPSLSPSSLLLSSSSLSLSLPLNILKWKLLKGINWKKIIDAVDIMANLHDIYEIWNSTTGKSEKWTFTELKNYIDEQSRSQHYCCGYNISLRLPLSSSSCSPSPSALSLPSQASSLLPSSLPSVIVTIVIVVTVTAFHLNLNCGLLHLFHY